MSASCGGVSAGAGLAAAHMLDAWWNRTADCGGVTEVLASLCGMVCDGAKATCALKGFFRCEDWDLGRGQGLVAPCLDSGDQGVGGQSIDEDSGQA